MDRGAWWATVCRIAENQHILVTKHTEREREKEKRIATEMSCRNELPLRSQAQEGLLCQCSQATGSEGLLLLMVPLELQEASPGSKPQSLALSWSSILFLFSFSSQCLARGPLGRGICGMKWKPTQWRWVRRKATGISRDGKMQGGHRHGTSRLQPCPLDGDLQRGKSPGLQVLVLTLREKHFPSFFIVLAEKGLQSKI